MLGKRIKELRQRNKITLGELAIKSGFPVDTLSRIENGEIGRLDNQGLFKIADNLNIKHVYDFAYLMELNKATRRFRAFVVGLPRTGTISLKRIFGNYYSLHEFMQGGTEPTIIKFKQNRMSKNEFRKFVLKRDLLAAFPEIDSAFFHHYYLDVLVEEFAHAKFICLIRDCYSWLNSYINHFITHTDHGMILSEKCCNGMPFDIPVGGCREIEELVNNFDKYIDMPLSHWASSYRSILKKLPPGRSLIIKTNEISEKIHEIADFINVPRDSLLKYESHSNKAEYKMNILLRLDHDFLKAKFNEHCSDLMQEFFPAYSLDVFLDEKRKSVKHSPHVCRNMKIIQAPGNVDLAITTRCNLHCKYCAHFESAGEVKADLPKEEWLEFFKELNQLDVKSVCLQGAEPFARKDLKELLKGIVSNKMRFSILSNGTLITDEMASFLAETKSCANVQVSIDGSISIIHDAARGEGNFDKAMNGIKNLVKHNVSVSARATIHKGNVRDLDKIAELLLDKIGLAGFSTNSASYMGLCRRNAEELMLSPEEQGLAMETLLRLNKKYDNRISATAGPLSMAKHWSTMEIYRIIGKRHIPGGGHLTSCGGVMSKIAVRADGAIIPCIQISHIELGKINKDSLKEVWHNHPKLKQLRERRDIPLSNFEFCRNCEYINYCRGGCPALSYTFCGDEYQPSPDVCLRKFLREGGTLPDKKLLVN